MALLAKTQGLDLDSLSEFQTENPNHIWIEPTNRCNTRCRHCDHFYRVFGEDMELDLYEKIEREVLDGVERAELIGYGEPFMGKNFMRMFDACVERGITIFTTSNGILLRDPELAAKVVRNDVKLNLSIDGARQETFERIRPYVRWKGIVKTLETLKENGVWLVGCTAEAPAGLYETDLNRPLAIVMGSEGSGMRRLTREHCDYLANIPMSGQIESLNVSVATGIFLFEALRQRSSN